LGRNLRSARDQSLSFCGFGGKLKKTDPVRVSAPWRVIPDHSWSFGGGFAEGFAAAHAGYAFQQDPG